MRDGDEDEDEKNDEVNYDRLQVLDFAEKLLLRDANVAYGGVDDMKRLACLNEPADWLLASIRNQIVDAAGESAHTLCVGVINIGDGNGKGSWPFQAFIQIKKQRTKAHMILRVQLWVPVLKPNGCYGLEETHQADATNSAIWCMNTNTEAWPFVHRQKILGSQRRKERDV
ncbi:hypothetical protein Tco_1028365 [Tanacetum coccineum]|uniref:Uncharacterized protein n=1 Tax=Tanacetum coccineum TaxID=301880 RepID=A0ABQ5G1Z0_9ASTR